ncbi:MAG: molybdopterin-synthase adenylyltransferase MoeB [Pseudomonadales bacterium]|nr:molybdopterin-synthase adenylyltransferase MoeB [Pseudomonadales bacterium]
MNDDELLRYSRQIMLPDFDVADQEQLISATALIIGLGGLGSPASLYLASAGIGHLILCDDDEVDLSNLQRQIVHTTSRIGMNKAESARRQLLEINPNCRVTTIDHRPNESELDSLISQATVVLDCTDNFGSRFAINAACWQANTPLVSGAGIRWEGQVAVFDPRQDSAPCYNCLYDEEDDSALNCSENGVIAPLVGIIGACQALEAIKVVTGVGENLVGKILYFDGKYMEWRTLILTRRAGCPVCNPG